MYQDPRVMRPRIHRNERIVILFVTPSISLSSGTYFSVKQVTRACDVAADWGGVAVTEMRVFLLHARDSITRYVRWSVRRSPLAFFRR